MMLAMHTLTTILATRQRQASAGRYPHATEEEDARHAKLLGAGDIQFPDEGHGHDQDQDVRHHGEDAVDQNIDVFVDALALDRLIPESIDRGALKDGHDDALERPHEQKADDDVGGKGEPWRGEDSLEKEHDGDLDEREADAVQEDVGI